jgi:hypothetical protein
MSIPNPPAAQATSNRATISLVLGIVGLVCCQIAAPFAWYMGNKELAAIAAGTSPASNEGMAKAGKIIGIIGTLLIAFWLVWIVGFGGMAVVGGLMNQGK